jgi:hypothetical protein
MLRRTFFAMSGLAAFAGLGIGACSFSTNGNAPFALDASADVTSVPEAGPDVAEPFEATIEDAARMDAVVDAPEDVGAPDAPTCTAANCAGACCGDRCVDTSCAGCNVGSLFCPYSTTVFGSNGQCVSSCSACLPDGIPLAVACFSCSGASHAGACAASASNCPATLGSGACPCAGGDAGGCPGASQVCAPGAADASAACLTCGQAGTQGQACHSGSTCNQTSGACAP